MLAALIAIRNRTLRTHNQSESEPGCELQSMWDKHLPPPPPTTQHPITYHSASCLARIHLVHLLPTQRRLIKSIFFIHSFFLSAVPLLLHMLQMFELFANPQPLLSLPGLLSLSASPLAQFNIALCKSIVTATDEPAC